MHIGNILHKELIFWIVATVLFLIMLYYLSPVLLPFIVGLLLAYLLNPLINMLSRLGISRVISSLCILLTFVAGALLLIFFFLPIFLTQLWQFLVHIPTYLEELNNFLLATASEWVEKNVLIGRILLRDSFTNLLQQSGSFVSTLLVSLWTSGKVLVNIVSFLVIAPVIAFYFMVDWPRMVAIIDSWIPRKHVQTVRRLFSEIDGALAGFIRGQSILALIVAVYYIFTLGIIGLKYSFLISILIGILSFIPYVGTLIGFILATGGAFLQFGLDGWIKIAMTIGVFMVGQFCEGYILHPKLVGHSVGLHPIWLLLSLFVFSYLLGFTGALLAVPVAAIVGVLIRFVLRLYLRSSLYN